MTDRAFLVMTVWWLVFAFITVVACAHISDAVNVSLCWEEIYYLTLTLSMQRPWHWKLPCIWPTVTCYIRVTWCDCCLGVWQSCVKSSDYWRACLKHCVRDCWEKSWLETLTSDIVTVTAAWRRDTAGGWRIAVAMTGWRACGMAGLMAYIIGVACGLVAAVLENGLCPIGSLRGSASKTLHHAW